MKTKILAAALAVATAAPAFAGSLSQPAVDNSAVAPAIDPIDLMDAQMSTDWTGGYIGLGLGSTNVGGDVDGDGTTLGLHAGYNMDLGDFVVGGELAYNPMDVEFDGGAGDFTSMTAKVRGGYDMGTVLPYVSLGVQRGTIDTAGGDLTDTGMVYGVGVDYMLNQSMVLGGELSRASYDDFDGTGADVDTTTLGVRLSMKF